MTLQEFKEYYDTETSYPEGFSDLNGEAILTIVNSSKYDPTLTTVLSGDNCSICGPGVSSFSLVNENNKIIAWVMLQKPTPDKQALAVIKTWLIPNKPPTSDIGPWNTVRDSLL